MEQMTLETMERDDVLLRASAQVIWNGRKMRRSIQLVLLKKHSNNLNLIGVKSVPVAVASASDAGDVCPPPMSAAAFDII